MEHSKQLAPTLSNTPPSQLTALAMHIDIPVRWGDMDAYGHVNNTVYFRYIEQCRMEWFDLLGSKTTMDIDQVPVLVGTECRFIRAITYPATVRVTQQVVSINGKVVNMEHELWVAGTLCATGKSSLVWMSRAANKAIPLPAHITEQLKLPA